MDSLLPDDDINFEDPAMLLLLFFLVVVSQTVFYRFADYTIEPPRTDLSAAEDHGQKGQPVRLVVRVSSQSDIALAVDNKITFQVAGFNSKEAQRAKTSTLRLGGEVDLLPSEESAVAGRLEAAIAFEVRQARRTKRGVEALVYADHRARLGTTTQVQLALSRLVVAGVLASSPPWRTLSDKGREKK